MERKAVVVCLVVSFLSLLSAGLAFAAEITKIQVCSVILAMFRNLSCFSRLLSFTIETILCFLGKFITHFSFYTNYFLLNTPSSKGWIYV